MRFDPSQLTLKRGETVTFVVHNAGKLMHEFVIGTPAAAGRARAVDEEAPRHGTRRAVHGACGAGQDAAHQLDLHRAGEFLAGCLVAGHWDAGMKATTARQGVNAMKT